MIQVISKLVQTRSGQTVIGRPDQASDMLMHVLALEWAVLTASPYTRDGYYSRPLSVSLTSSM